MFELILAVNNLTIQEHYKQLLAEKLGFAYEILNSQFKRFKASDGRLLLIQQQRQQEKQQSASYQIQRDALFLSLLNDNGLQKYLDESEIANQLSAFIQKLAKADESSALARMYQQQLTEEELHSLQEFSLWRDKQLEEHPTAEKRYQIILQTLLPHLQTLLQLALKSPRLSADEKEELLQMRRLLQIR